MISVTQTKIAAVILGVGVILGAFGAHSLKAILTADQLGSWKTAVLYLFIHALGMFVLSLAPLSEYNQRIAKQSFYLFLVGIFCFSGSIFLLTIQDKLGMDLSWLGPITPIGGLQFMLGWGNLLRFTSQVEDR